MKKIITIMMSLILVLGLGVTATFAAAGLNIALLNQNPDPVSPGNFVYLNIKISNIGSDVIEDATIIFNENDNFKVANGENVEKNLGTLSAFSTSDNLNSFIVAKYKVLVDESTPTGLNTVNFDLKTSNSQSYNYEFDVLVQDSNPQVTVSSIEIPQIEPGNTAKLKLSLLNENSLSLKDVKIVLDLANVDNEIITLDKGSNEQLIGNLEAGKEIIVEYDVAISPEADSKPYLLPIKISYDDNLENTFENTIYASVKVYSAPELSLALDSQEVYTIGKGKFSLAIANPGSSKIKGVQMEILNSDDYEIIEGKNQYVGDLNPDDFQTLQGDVYVKNDESAVLKVKLIYGDSYDKREEKIIEIPLKIYNDEELVQFGFKSANTSPVSYGGYLVVIILTALVTFFITKRSYNKKLKRKN